MACVPEDPDGKLLFCRHSLAQFSRVDSSTVPSVYRIKTVVMENGERLPTLLDDTTGLPVFEPMAYILSEARARGLAANTITAQLAAIEFLLIHAAESTSLSE
jgi:hypothetical protein